MGVKTLQYSYNNKPAFYFAIAGMSISFIACLLTTIFTFSYSGFMNDGTPYIHANAWWSFFQYFTIQTNLLVLAFFTCFWINQWKPFLKSNTLQNLAVSYITVTCLVYTTLLMPGDIAVDKGGVGQATFYWIQNSLVHIISPLTIIGFAICQFCTRNPTYKSQKFLTYTLISLIYPTIYIIYVIMLPFVSKHSVYGALSNLNKNLTLHLQNGTDVAGSMSNLALVFGVWFLFCASACGYYWLDRKIKRATAK